MVCGSIRRTPDTETGSEIQKPRSGLGESSGGHQRNDADDGTASAEPCSWAYSGGTPRAAGAHSRNDCRRVQRRAGRSALLMSFQLERGRHITTEPGTNGAVSCHAEEQGARLRSGAPGPSAERRPPRRMDGGSGTMRGRRRAPGTNGCRANHPAPGPVRVGASSRFRQPVAGRD